MSETTSRLYLVTPPVSVAADALPAIAAALGAGDVACLLLRLAPGAERDLKAICKAIAPVVQDAGTALLVEDPRLAAHVGADGAHVAGAGADLKAALDSLKPDRIVGAGRLASRDDAMSAGEAGVDYLMFGDEESATDVVEDGRLVGRDLQRALRRLRRDLGRNPTDRGGRGGVRGTRPRRVRRSARARGRREGRARGAGRERAGRRLGMNRSAGRRLRAIALIATCTAASGSGFAAAQSPSLSADRATPAVPMPAPASPGGFLPSPTGPGLQPAGTAPGVDARMAAFGAFQRGYFATALAEATAWLETNATDGAAMTLIGELYSEGLAVKTDAAEADRWFKLASDRGNREGSFAYALALLRGTGVQKDVPAAIPYLERAAAQGHPGALYNLGVMVLQGDPKTRDDAKAAALFQRSAEGGDLDATYALGNMVKAGDGVPRDYARAADLFKSAADRGDPAAQVDYAIMAFNGEGIPKDEAEAARYFKMAAFGGNPVAANRLARLYAAGRGVDKNAIEAARWHLLARAAGVGDVWLDGVLTSLTPADRAKVESELRRTLAN